MSGDGGNGNKSVRSDRHDDGGGNNSNSDGGGGGSSSMKVAMEGCLMGCYVNVS